MNQDLEHLKLLSIFYYVGAALAALCTCIFPIFLGFTITRGGTGVGGPELLVLGGMALVFTLFCAGVAVCLALTGKYLVEKTHYNFCFAMAVAVACVFVPLGTALGVLTLLVLLRDSVKNLFGVPAMPVPAPAHS